MIVFKRSKNIKKQKKQAQRMPKDYLKLISLCLHYGHKPKEWNPKMSHYILAREKAADIIDLVKTRKCLSFVGDAVFKKAKSNHTFLFVGTDRFKCNSSNIFYINKKWQGGTLTNWLTIQKQMQKLKLLEKLIIPSEANYNQEIVKKKKELLKLRESFQGIENMTKIPDFIIFLNLSKNILALNECRKLGIPTACIVDTNINPELTPYPIPSNDDSELASEYITSFLLNKISQGARQASYFSL